MFKKIAIAALTVAVSATAFSASANEQLAASLGVDASTYSTSELVRLGRAIEDNNTAEVNFILKHSVETTRASGVNEVFSAADQIRLNRALEDNNTAEVNFILSGVASDMMAQNPQLAASIGVDADKFSAAELIRLQRALEDNKTSEVNFIVNS